MIDRISCRKTIFNSKFILICCCFVNIFTSVVFSDIKGTGEINFKPVLSEPSKMVLNSTGLGIGTTPSANLHVSGNMMVDQLSIGSSVSDSNLHLSGTMGFSHLEVSSNTILGENSIVLVDNSQEEIELFLPMNDEVNGQKVSIKTTSTQNNVMIYGLSGASDYFLLSPSSTSLPSIEVIKGESVWYELSSYGNVMNESVASENLVGHWGFDNVSGNIVTDHSALSNNGAVSNISSSNINVTGVVGDAIYTDGVDDEIVMGNIMEYNVPSGDSFSISVWLKSDAIMAGTVGQIFRKHDSGTLNYLLKISTGKPQFVMEDGVGTFTVATSYKITDDNEWHHIVFVINKSDSMGYLYIDKDLNNSASIAGMGDLIMSNDISMGSGWQGHIDELRFYNKALTADEVLSLYKSGQAGL